HVPRPWLCVGGKEGCRRAVADYNEAIRIYPSYAEAYDRRGHTWQSEGNLGRAIAVYNEAIRIDPKHLDATASRGTRPLLQGRRRALGGGSCRSPASSEMMPIRCSSISRPRPQRSGWHERALWQHRDAQEQDLTLCRDRVLSGSPLARLDARGGDKAGRKMRSRLLCRRVAAVAGKQARRQDGAAAANTCPKTFFEYYGAVAELKRIENY